MQGVECTSREGKEGEVGACSHSYMEHLRGKYSSSLEASPGWADGNHWDGSRDKEVQVLGGVSSSLSSFSSDTLVLLKKDKDKANDSL